MRYFWTFNKFTVTTTLPDPLITRLTHKSSSGHLFDSCNVSKIVWTSLFCCFGLSQAFLMLCFSSAHPAKNIPPYRFENALISWHVSTSGVITFTCHLEIYIQTGNEAKDPVYRGNMRNWEWMLFMGHSFRIL